MYLQSEFIEVDPVQLDQLKRAAARDPLKRARLCLHKDHDDRVQEMVIAVCRDSHIQPHRQVNKKKSYKVIEGDLRIIFFDNLGRPKQAIEMGSLERGKKFLCRFSGNQWHTVLPLSDVVVYVETIEGPYAEGDTEFAPWQPSISLVIGADGAIGRALVNQLGEREGIVLETTRHQGTLSERRLFLDLMEDTSTWRPPCPVSVAYLCGGVSSVEHCRRHPEPSARVNVYNTVALAKTVTRCGAFVIFPSTNLVFDGLVPFRKAEAPVCPATEYGREKAETERALLAMGECTSVVRFTKILEQSVPLFNRWVQALQNNEPIHPFSDMVIAPVSLSFAVEVLCQVAEARLPGIIQVSGRQDVTYEQIARHVARQIGASETLVQPVTARLRPEEVPQYTTLDTTRLREQLGLHPPDVWSVVDSLIAR